MILDEFGYLARKVVGQCRGRAKSSLVRKRRPARYRSWWLVKTRTDVRSSKKYCYALVYLGKGLGVILPRKYIGKRGLKTLKDIEFGRTEKEDRGMLREEAIKWIKEIQSSVMSRAEEDSIHGSLFYSINWIKRFFNLTEEDLK